jgi:hypothetical protein
MFLFFKLWRFKSESQACNIPVPANWMMQTQSVNFSVFNFAFAHATPTDMNFHTHNVGGSRPRLPMI